MSIDKSMHNGVSITILRVSSLILIQNILDFFNSAISNYYIDSTFIQKVQG